MARPLFITDTNRVLFLHKKRISFNSKNKDPFGFCYFIIINMEENGFEYIKLDEYEGNPIIGRVVFILENGIKEKEI